MWMEKILFITVFAIALYLSINVIQKFSIKFDLLGEIIKELKLGYIEDFVASNSTVCPKDYESLVINTYWPGSYKGCGCKNDDKSTFSFYPNYCPKLRECYSVEETNRKEFTFWRGANICFKRSNIDYSKMNVVKKSNNLNEDNNEELICSNSTHKNCGIIDGKKYYLCMERSKECPVNEIRFEKIEGAQINVNVNDNNDGNNNEGIRDNSNSKRDKLEIENLNVIEETESEEKIKYDSGFKISEPYVDKDAEIAEKNKMYLTVKDGNLKGKGLDINDINFDVYRKNLLNDGVNNNKNDRNHFLVNNTRKDKNKDFIRQKNHQTFEDFKNAKHFEFNLTELNIIEEEHKTNFFENKKDQKLRLLQDSQLVKFTNSIFTATDDNLKNTNSSYNKDGFYTLNLSNNYQLIFSKNEMKQTDSQNKLKTIPLFFRTETNNPCLDSLKKPSSEYFFPLMKNKLDFLCDLSDNKTEILDERLEVLDSLPLSEFYKQNNYLKEIERVTAPFGIDVGKKIINLYSRNYLGWSSKCLANSPESLQNFLKIEESLNHLLIMNILHSFISIGGIIALGIFACFLSQYFELFFKLVNLGFCLLNLIFPIQILSNSNWIINLFTDEDGVFCGDNTLNILLIEVSNSCLEMQNSYIWILIITIFYSFVYIYMLYKWIKPFHQEYQNKFKNYMSIK